MKRPFLATWRPSDNWYVQSGRYYPLRRCAVIRLRQLRGGRLELA